MKFPLVTRMTVASFDAAGADAAGVDAAGAGWLALAMEWMDMMNFQEKPPAGGPA
jgi:1,6-anhydro-N-acetylmuramate kinase